jgi:hypothetical protein
MAEQKEQYPFNVTWHGGLDDPMFTVRAETVEQFRERCGLILEGWEAAQPVVTKDGTLIEGGEQVPPNVTPIVTLPAPTPPSCVFEGCGKQMVWRTGVKDGVEWKGWFCPTRNRAHKAIWV